MEAAKKNETRAAKPADAKANGKAAEPNGKAGGVFKIRPRAPR